MGDCCPNRTVVDLTEVSTICAEVIFRVKVMTFARDVEMLVNCQQQSY